MVVVVVLVVVFSFVLYSFCISFLYFFSVAGSLGLKIFQSSDHFLVPFVCDDSGCGCSNELC